MKFLYGIKVPKETIDMNLLNKTEGRVRAWPLSDSYVFGVTLKEGLCPYDTRKEINAFALTNLAEYLPELKPHNVHLYSKFYEV